MASWAWKRRMLMAMTGMIAIISTIAMALPRPKFPKLNISWYIELAITWVSYAPLVMTYTMSNAFNAVMITVVATTARVGVSSGKMIPRKTCHSLAPSTRAASSSSALIPLSAAEMITMQKPVHIQVVTRTSRIVLKLKVLTVSYTHLTLPTIYSV